MPCEVELTGEKHGCDYTWYCCNCGDGPNAWAVSSACNACNNHERCSPGHITPLGSPPWTEIACRSSSRKGVISRDKRATSPKSVAPLNETSLINTCLDGDLKADTSFGHSVGYHPAGSVDSPTGEHCSSLDAAVERCANTILDVRHSLLSRQSLASVGEIRSYASESKNACDAETGLLISKSKQAHRKRGLGHRQKGFKRRRNEYDSDDDNPGTRKGADPARNIDSITPRTCQYVCPFLRQNPHRYRHVKSCSRPYAKISDLREHLTRQGSPHSLHDCSRCRRAFQNEEHLNDHDSGECQPESMYYPAEGIGANLQQGLPELRGGPRAETSREDDRMWWNDVYRLLFGEGVQLLSCYFNDKADIARSNDVEKQNHFRDLLAQTLRRQLPEELMERAVRFHCLSTLQTEVHQIKRLLGRDVESPSAHNALSRPLDVVWSRRRRSVVEERPESEPLHRSEAVSCSSPRSTTPTGDWHASTVEALNARNSDSNENDRIWQLQHASTLTPIGHPVEEMDQSFYLLQPSELITNLDNVDQYHNTASGISEPACWTPHDSFSYHEGDVHELNAHVGIPALLTPEALIFPASTTTPSTTFSADEIIYPGPRQCEEKRELAAHRFALSLDSLAPKTSYRNISGLPTGDPIDPAFALYQTNDPAGGDLQPLGDFDSAVMSDAGLGAFLRGGDDGDE